MNTRKFKNLFIKKSIFLIAGFNIIILFLIFFFIFTNGIMFFESFPIKNFFMGKEWISLSDKYGLLPLLMGSFWVTLVALLISIPLSLITAIYIAEYTKPKTRKNLKILMGTMSSLPSISVVLGYIGIYLLSNPVQKLFGLNTGLTAFTAGILLAIMSIPTMTNICEDSIQRLDHSYKEASLALGANKLETIVKIILPGASPKIFGGIMIGFGKIIGETMTVLMVTGNAPILDGGIFLSVRTITATIAAEMGEVVQGSTHYYSLFALALVLFIITFIINTIACYFMQRSKK